MPSPFSRTLRALETDRGGRKSFALSLVLLLAGWSAWFFFAEVAVYEVTSNARVEVSQAAHSVFPRVEGQVILTNLALGRFVARNEVLLELEAHAEEQAVEEKRRHHASLVGQLTALRSEIAAERRGLNDLEQTVSAAIAERRAQTNAAEKQASSLERQLARLNQLRRTNAASTEEYEKVQRDAQASRASATALALGIPRLEREGTLRATDRQIIVTRRERESADLEGQVAIAVVALRRLEHACELRRIRAPVAGTIGEVGEFRIGAVVRPSDRLGSVVPPGQPRAVCWFPVAALGRLRSGQAARLRLDGFPWTQYGTLSGVVAHIATEANGGTIRVELALTPNQDTPIPLDHGLTASAEVETDRLSPALLLLRAAGKWLAARR